MCRLQSKRIWQRKLNKFIPLFAFFVFMSCGFADLRHIGFNVEPGESETVLPGEYSPVILGFDTDMDRQATEGIIKVSADAVMVNGDIRWEGRRMLFVPSAGWAAGTRYTLNVSGLARAKDGRELRLEKCLFFYAINKKAAPCVEWFCPADGESTGTGCDEEFFIAIRFSCAMDRLSAERAFAIDGIGGKKFEWSDDGTLLKIIPDKNLSPWTDYRWSLKNSARSADGVPLAKAVSARFCTDKDTLLPKVARVYPVLFSGGRWLPTGGGIEGDLGPNQGIAVEFNKPMSANVHQSIRFDPSLAGRSEKLSETRYVYIPSRDPEPGTEYTLIIPVDTKDASGQKIGEEFRLHFTADIPYLQVLSFTADGVPSVSPEDMAGALAVPVDVDGVLRFALRFSLPFNLAAKQSVPFKISLTPLFPGTLPPLALRFVTWLSDDCLRMEWEGLKPGTAGQPHYFKLLLPSGRAGIDTGEGMYLKQDLIIYLEAQE